jgi:hypothetical protein
MDSYLTPNQQDLFLPKYTRSRTRPPQHPLLAITHGSFCPSFSAACRALTPLSCPSAHIASALTSRALHPASITRHLPARNLLPSLAPCRTSALAHSCSPACVCAVASHLLHLAPPCSVLHALPRALLVMPCFPTSLPTLALYAACYAFDLHLLHACVNYN